MVNEIDSAGLLRLIGLMSIAVGMVWAIQILAFGDAGASIARLSWVLGAATIAGAGAGLMFASKSVAEAHAHS